MHPARTLATHPSILRRRPLRSHGLALGAALTLSPHPALAGEVRVGVGIGGLFFGARVVNCNLGDHVIWVWGAGTHSSTAGDSSTATPNGEWDSGLLSGITTNNTGAFSWQATSVGVHPFFCNPHAPGMAGRVIVASSGIAVADLRITEAQYNEAAGHDLIEITNLGTAAGDLGRFRLSRTAGTGVALAPNTLPIAVNATITIHANEAGTNTANDVFLPTLGALSDAAGSVALYVPNTKAGTSLNDAT